ncbi:threonine/serine dehydratase [Oscillatoria sp. FACHB-1407]|uniref:threonine/serine dehydratase n=1 Tax=Oscillatoria sp. FACHB-1407 TaxID=2692847 RepID=UPI001685FF9C|nr:threonine/serine dehydratase [Oscillatoria sp. FACHB-1407]MBD2463158.1 threonine/serine dehydratase [Oscillatoria sp. FACHB-1407]
MTDLKTEILLAEQRIRPYVRQTFLEQSPIFSQMTNCSVFFKLENLQYTGSFKVRGATNKLLSLSAEQRSQGIVVASSGNHGAATAFALRQVQGSGIVFVPQTASPTKVEAIRRLGAEVRFQGDDAALTEGYAREYADQNGMVYISPYNDLQVIAGQGTIAVELINQLEQMDAVFVSVGGGGLISGIAGFLKAMSPRIQIIGCLPQNSPVMAESVKANQILDLPVLPTLSDGTAGGIEPGAITFEFCRTLVDQFVLVTEAEISAAMRLFMETHHQLIEGAAAVAIAALLQASEAFQHQTVAVVLCGANIDLAKLKGIL